MIISVDVTRPVRVQLWHSAEHANSLDTSEPLKLHSHGISGAATQRKTECVVLRVVDANKRVSGNLTVANVTRKWLRYAKYMRENNLWWGKYHSTCEVSLIYSRQPRTNANCKIACIYVHLYSFVDPHFEWSDLHWLPVSHHATYTFKFCLITRKRLHSSHYPTTSLPISTDHPWKMMQSDAFSYYYISSDVKSNTTLILVIKLQPGTKWIG